MVNCIALCLALAVVAFGETKVTSTVTDESGAAISGAMILIHWDSAGNTVGLRARHGHVSVKLSVQTGSWGQTWEDRTADHGMCEYYQQ
jgi:hypothetical protein